MKSTINVMSAILVGMVLLLILIHWQTTKKINNDEKYDEGFHNQVYLNRSYINQPYVNSCSCDYCTQPAMMPPSIASNNNLFYGGHYVNNNMVLSNPNCHCNNQYNCPCTIAYPTRSYNLTYPQFFSTW
jgi:hypothetical protein